MSEVPHREAGAAALDLRHEPEQRCCRTICGLRAIELLHDERRLRDELVRLPKTYDQCPDINNL
jgi:hypothetical protein